MGELAPGDVVQLKSGGQSMTVEALEDHGYVACVWFDNTNNNLQRASIKAAALNKR